MRFLLVNIFLLSFFAANARHAEEEIASIKKTITQLFDGMREGDSAKVRDVFTSESKLFSVARVKNVPALHEENVKEFIAAIGTPHDKIWDERLLSWKFTIDGDFAVVITDYIFFHGTKFSHCGINMFQLIVTEKGWKIFQITDTRRTDCMEDPDTGTTLKPKPTESRLINLLDNWHRAAARGDLKTFAALMDPEFIYLGTDKTERWTKDTFITFCKPYFEREQGGWNFKPYSRQLYFSDDYRFAWFEEHLSTWMGVCRGTGVFRYSPEGWKLMHYNLAMTIKNDDVKKVLEATGGNK